MSRVQGIAAGLRAALGLALLHAAPARVAAAQTLVRSEFVYESAPFPSAHASTIVETRGGLAAAWFGGTRERAPDVGIWLSRHEHGAWTPPVEVATGVEPDGTRYPCWNPVLFRMPDGTLALFYKVGPSPAEWWGVVRTSRGEGRTWSARPTAVGAGPRCRCRNPGTAPRSRRSSRPSCRTRAGVCRR